MQVRHNKEPEAPRKYCPNELAFALEDYQQRISDFQNHFKRQELAAGLIFVPENFFWLTDSQAILDHHPITTLGSCQATMKLIV